jgi:uncharacterized protein YjbI with pentapeptide repeats
MELKTDIWRKAVSDSQIQWDDLPKEAQEWLVRMEDLLPKGEKPGFVTKPGQKTRCPIEWQSPDVMITLNTLTYERDQNKKTNKKEPSEETYRFNWTQFKKLLDSAKSGKCDSWNEWRADRERKDSERKDSNKFQLCLSGVDLSLSAVGAKNGALFKANLSGAELKRADLREVHLTDANLCYADLSYAQMQGAILQEADLVKSDLYRANLSDAICERCDVTATKTNGIEYNRDTYFTGSNLVSARMLPEVRSSLEYNIRRRRWSRWRQCVPLLQNDGDMNSQDEGDTDRQEGSVQKFMKFLWHNPQWLIRTPGWIFMWLSDFGTSTRRIIAIFCFASLAFAMLYWCWPSLIYDYGLKHPEYSGFTFTRAIYFSVVTMTTLGFGDIRANSTNNGWSHAGQIILALHVILGYVILGLLVTRFGVLFTSLSPMAHFDKTRQDKKKQDEL